MKTLFVSDLDGTLLQPDARLSDTTVGLLNDAIARGKLFTIATARTPATADEILKRVDIQLPAIVMTGAALWNRDANLYSRIKYMRPEAVKRLLRIYEEMEMPTFIYTLVDNMIHIYHQGEISPLARQFLDERIHNPFKRVEEGPLPADAENVILFYGMQPSEKPRATFEKMRRVEGVRPQFYHDIFGESVGILEAFAAEATKAKAMRAMARELGADRIVAFGDNVNDLPMMREADLAVAVENALPEVKEAADIVIGPNTDDSVARFIAES